MNKSVLNSFTAGLRDGVPIGLGYLSVSFTFGMMVVAGGMPIWVAVAISMTNLTSAGQFAGLSMMFSAASYFEVALTQLVINIRYSLMSLSLSQRIDPATKIPARLGISFGITDEVFAVASTKDERVGKNYMAGLISIPYVGWALGTLMGAVAGAFLPVQIQSALGIAIYGMFLAIIVPAAKKSFPVFVVILIAVVLSCAFKWISFLSGVSEGFVIIISSVTAAGLGAILFPKKEAE